MSRRRTRDPILASPAALLAWLRDASPYQRPKPHPRDFLPASRRDADDQRGSRLSAVQKQAALSRGGQAPVEWEEQIELAKAKRDVKNGNGAVKASQRRCLNCTKPMSPDLDLRQKHCSRKCALTYSDRKRLERERAARPAKQPKEKPPPAKQYPPLVCRLASCNAEFTPPTHKERYCSDSCSAEGKALRLLERYRRVKEKRRKEREGKPRLVNWNGRRGK